MAAKYIEARDVRTQHRTTMPVEIFRAQHPETVDRLERGESEVEFVGERPRYAVRLVEPPQACEKEAERADREQALGRRVLEILRGPPPEDERCEGITGMDARHLAAIVRGARSLGLLEDEANT